MPPKILHLLSRHLSTTTSTTTTSPPKPTDPSLLLRLCTILYQHQNSPLSKLHHRLSSIPLPQPSSHHELFLQACAKFPSSWRPIHNLHHFLTTSHSFSHSPTTFARQLDVLAKSRNISLLHSTLLDPTHRHLLSAPALRSAIRGLAPSREISKCAQFVSLFQNSAHETGALFVITETICVSCRLPDVAEKVVSRARRNFGVKPTGKIYELLIVGYCRAGEFAEACRVWNLMLREGLEVGGDAVEEIVVTLFKANRVHDAMRVFVAMRRSGDEGAGFGVYPAVVLWLCKEGRVEFACMVFGEMLKRGVRVDGETIGDLVYGLLVRRKVREGYRVFCGVRDKDAGLYHGLIKGLVRIKRAGEATEVFRDMVRMGCEPNMHTYIMLLQGHLGKRGRKGRDPLVNFASIFVGGLVKAGRTLEATKFVERMMWGGVDVPRFDYNKFLHYFSNEEGVVMFEEVGRRMREAGLIDLADIFLVYGQRMATRDRRRAAMNGLSAVS